MLEKRGFAEYKDFDIALDKILVGTKRKSFTTEHEIKKRTAVYQAGKAISSILLKDADPIYKVSILPKGDKTSGAITKSEVDKLSNNKKQIRAILKVALAGRASESLFYNGGVSTRCEEDMQRASKITLSYMRKMAMDEEVSLISAEKEDLSEKFNQLLEEKGTDFLNEVYSETTKLITENKSQIEKLADYLLSKETLSKDEVKEYLNI